jgi:hypothetical protein
MLHSIVRRWIAKGESDETIIVAGALRSGTTWLSEVISSLSGYALYDEPFISLPFQRPVQVGSSGGPISI